MNVTRRTLLTTATACFAAGPGIRVFAQEDWPARPIRLVSPYGAGGASDISVRILGEWLGRGLGQQFVVENKPGAGTRLANEIVAHAAPDGYTFLYAAAPYATAEAMYGKLNYDPRKDLQPVAMAVRAPIFLIVNAQTPFRNVRDLIAHGESRREGLTFASPGAGSQPHLAGELLFRDAGVKGLNVHFRGDATAYLELLAGRVDATRSPIYPQAPTLPEQGFSNVVAGGWYGFMAPAATPRRIVDRMQAEAIRALADPEVQKKLIAQGLEADGGSAARFGQFIDDETRKWSEVIRKIGLKG